MIDSLVFTPPTLLDSTPALSAAAGLTLHATTGNRQVVRADGVMGAPAPRDVTRTAPGRDGVIEDTRYLADRIIVLEGEVWGTSQRAVLDDWATLNSAFESTMLAQGQLTVTLPAASGGSTRQQWCKVTLASPAQVSLEGGSAYLSYQVSFRASDPRWFGMTQNTSALVIATTTTATSSSANVTNAGTAPSLPRFTWTSGTGRVFDNLKVNVPTTYSTLSPQGSEIKLSSASVVNALAANDYFDCATRTTSTSGILSATTEWPVLYPGTSSWNWTQATSSGSSSSSTCTMTWFDAWW
jgi:hypothetical protein